MLLITQPPGAMFPSGKHTVDDIPFSRARAGGEMTSSGSTPSTRADGRETAPALARLPLVEHLVPGTPVDDARVHVEQPEPTQVRHHLGHSAGEEDAHRRMVGGPFGNASTSRGTDAFTRRQSSTAGRRSPAACAIAGMWIRRFVQPPKAWTSIAFSIASSVTTSPSVRPSRHCA